MSTVCVLKVGAFWACSLQKGLQQDRIACLAGQVRLPAPADIFESAERNYWDQRCPDTTASFEAMETWSWQWLSSLRRMPRPLSRRRQLTTKPRFLAVIDTSVWEAKQMRIVKLVAKDMTRSVIQLENTDNRKLVRGSKILNYLCITRINGPWGKSEYIRKFILMGVSSDQNTGIFALLFLFCYVALLVETFQALSLFDAASF
ncbi:uncharacterized protein [Equus caballus]|uniref:uncharacterized protein isoform X2 n=1 Tax=Equus caballus TaxID=9796 RepID=UPI0038B29D62